MGTMASKAVLKESHAHTPTSAISAGGTTQNLNVISGQAPQVPLPRQIQLLGVGKVPTPISCTRLFELLQGYDSGERDFLVAGFYYGFHIPYVGPRSYRFNKNLPSAVQNPDILVSKINKEVALGRVAGPFPSVPLDNLQISPLGLVPKKTPNEFRVIHHLSYPYGKSINDGLDRQFCSVSYQSIDNAVQLLLKIGRGALMAKTDIDSAYRNVPIHPSDYDLLGFCINGQFYYDKTLPFGLSSACQLFERFSSSLQWILENKFCVPPCVHILDDFLFLGPPNSDSCAQSLSSFYAMSSDLGVPIKEEKTVHPTTVIVFLGLELDSIAMEVRLPLDKLVKIRAALLDMTKRRKVSLKGLQSLIGLLNFACSVVPPGRTFLRRLIDLTIGPQNPYHYILLKASARADLAAWSLFIEHFNGRALLLPVDSVSSDTLLLFTDASDLGMGCCFGTKWFSSSFPKHFLKYHITVREFLPIVVALELWSNDFKNKRIEFFCDNSAVVHIINKNTSKDLLLMKLMRRFMVLVLKHNIMFKAVHIPGHTNTAADLLSRLQVEEFLIQFPHMDMVGVEVPVNLLSL